MLWIITVGAGLAIRCWQSPFYIFNSADDDGLMVEMAKGFLDGRWSSSWSTTGTSTMVKPVGFPLFLAGAHFLPWSPLISGYLLYLLGVILIVNSWRRLSRSRSQTSILLAALVLNPIFFANDSQRIYRDIFVNDIAALAVGLSFVIGTHFYLSAAAASATRARVEGAIRSVPGRFQARRLAILGSALLMGGFAGLIMVTKPTWQWVLPALLAPLALSTIMPVRRRAMRFVRVIRLTLVIIIGSVAAFGVIEVVKTMNDHTYGVNLVEDFSTGALARTWDVWASVEAGPARHYVPITRPMRMAVYKVSPAAAEMENYLEAPTDPWKTLNCRSMHICNESGSLFEWDLQSAAASTGRIHSVRNLQQFFTTVANQISSACASGKLHCTSSPVLATGLPPLSEIPLTSVASGTVGGIWAMLWNEVPIEPPPGAAPTAAQYRLWSSVLSGMASPGTVVRGNSPKIMYTVLRVIDGLYGVFDVALLVVLLLGLPAWILKTGRLRNQGGVFVPAVTLSALFFLSTVLGVGTLAVFSAAQQPGYVLPLYWADFSLPAELFVLFGAFASWPMLRRPSGVARLLPREQVRELDVHPPDGRTLTR
ncbi:MAG: hypothetical protein ACRDVP_00635 [Acidimicrobiales bacterium]